MRSHDTVSHILQDKKGFIWISTRSGVDCFNGRNVKNYSLFGENIIVDGSGRMIYLTKDENDAILEGLESGADDYLTRPQVFQYGI